MALAFHALTSEIKLMPLKKKRKNQGWYIGRQCHDKNNIPSCLVTFYKHVLRTYSPYRAEVQNFKSLDRQIQPPWVFVLS